MTYADVEKYFVGLTVAEQGLFAREYFHKRLEQVRATIPGEFQLPNELQNAISFAAMRVAVARNGRGRVKL
jgi:hypothetical protein